MSLAPPIKLMVNIPPIKMVMTREMVCDIAIQTLHDIYCICIHNYTHAAHTLPGEPHHVFFWDAGRICIENRKNTHRTRTCRTELVDVGWRKHNYGTQTRVLERQNSYSSRSMLRVSFGTTGYGKQPYFCSLQLPFYNCGNP